MDGAGLALQDRWVGQEAVESDGHPLVVSTAWVGLAGAQLLNPGSYPPYLRLRARAQFRPHSSLAVQLSGLEPRTLGLYSTTLP